MQSSFQLLDRAIVALHSGIGFMWPSTFGLAATLAVGMPLAAR